MMKRKKGGFALVFTVITLALAMGIFFRYSMNVRSKGVKVITQKKLSDMEDSAKKAMSLGINETYLIDQMIINRRDFNFNGTVTSNAANPGTGIKKTALNIFSSKDYFIVKDKYYEGNVAASIPHEKIWQAGASNQYNIENIWLRVNKRNEGGEVSKLDPRYYVDGKNTFTTEKFDKEVRFSKGGYYMKSIKVDEASKATAQCNDEYIYFAEYSEFNNTSKKTCYLNAGGTGVTTNEYSSGTVDPIATVDPIHIYLNNITGGIGETKFIVRVKKDIAYVAYDEAEKNNVVVAAFEGIADIRVTYNNGNKVSGNPNTIEVINYEINHLGP